MWFEFPTWVFNVACLNFAIFLQSRKTRNWPPIRYKTFSFQKMQPWLCLHVDENVPPIRQWIGSCRKTRKVSSKSKKDEGPNLSIAATAMELGAFSLWLNWRRRHPFWSADGTTFHTPRLKGPSLTHRVAACSPLPPKPLFPPNQMEDGPAKVSSLDFNEYVFFRMKMKS